MSVDLTKLANEAKSVREEYVWAQLKRYTHACFGHGDPHDVGPAARLQWMVDHPQLAELITAGASS